MQTRIPIAPGFLPAPTFSAPLVIDDAAITANGSNVFTGNWANDSYSANSGAAILLMTNQPVIIRNSLIVAQKWGIFGNESPGRNLTVENSMLLTRNTTQAGEAAGYGIRLWEPASLVSENNTFIGGGGISMRGSASYVNATSLCRIRYNRAINLMGLLSDGAGGYQFERLNTQNVYFQTRQFVQFDKLHVPTGGVEIAWNEVVNDPFVSRPEDSISIYGARGTAPFPVLVHDNYIQGGSPTRPYDVGMSGTGIVCEKDSRYVLIEDNQIVSYGNAAITLANSDHCSALRNRAVGDGRVNGRVSFSRREAFLLYNAEAVPPNAQTTNCSFENNLHAWSGPGGSLTAAYAPEAGSNGNFLSGMTSLGTPDEAMELAEWALWRAKVAAAGVRLGSTLAV